MRWDCMAIGVFESGEGYRVLAQGAGDAWVYSAFGPAEKITETSDDDGKHQSFRGHEYKAHYARGEVVPPAFNYKTRTARWLIDCFRSDQYGSPEAAAAAARAACADDMAEQFEKIIEVDNGR